ncbi:uncharacterized protein LOC141886102 isoform X3 [Acropora palmata]|uniref:uncharacterized protein LOC141886102 isoform X3 n=1 Tax=Acropora palmata TaxID=6131 RepID=UPI003DA08580
MAVYWKFLNMVQVTGNFSVHSRILFWVIVLVLTRICRSLYPYPVWGSPYESADHFWPMYNITDGILEDVEGAAHTMVYNGGKIAQVPQLEHALFLDGVDDYVDTGGFNADCVTEPSRCSEGFTLAFWLKVNGTGYIMSSGSFTNHRNGPGYQLYYHESLRRFKFLLETRDSRWSLLLHEEVGLWTHMTFTWNNRDGLRYYEDGNLSTFTKRPVSVSPLRRQNYTPVITLARPSNMRRLGEYGKFEISKFAIWLKELSTEEVAGVYRKSVEYNQENVLCCYFQSVNCVSNPCHDSEQCQRKSQSQGKTCICPEVNLRRETCKEKITDECEDKSTGCREFAAQSHYCKHRKMRKICPRSCSYCAPERLSTTVKPTLSTGPTLMSRVLRESKDASSRSQSKVPYTTAKPTTVTHRTTPRKMTTGKSCEVLLCKNYAQCIATDEGHAQCRCPQNCSAGRRPVCGTNGKSYLNMCALKKEACNLGQMIRERNHGLCSEPFADAAHYFPLNGTNAVKKLVDMRGNASAKAFNGVQALETEQLAAVLKMDGKDDFIEIEGFDNNCVVNPTMCTEGLSVAFWIRYFGGEFIISGGDYTKGDHGPGFRFICENCGQKKHPHVHKTQRFLLELSTEEAKWKILLESIPSWWFHFAFTWNGNKGLKFYENGKLALSNNFPVSVERRSTDPKNTIMTIGRANSITGLVQPKFGNFSIGHLVIWTYALSSFDVEVAFMLVQDKTAKSIKCCSQMKADPCIKNPCHNGATCHRIEDKYRCICPDASRPSHCSPEHKLPQPCRDKSPQCLEFARQTGYCDYRKKRMRALCPEACNFCGFDTSPGAGLLTSSQGVELLTSTESQKVSLTLNEQFPLMVSSTFRTSSSTSVSATTSSFVIVPSSSTHISSPTAPVSTTSQTSFQVKISASFTGLVKSRVSALSTLSTDNIESREKFLTTATSIFYTRVKTASSFSFSTSVQSLSTNSVPSQDESVIACKVKNTTCLCYNCEGAHINVAICCMDLIDIQHLQHGVIMNMTDITVWGFYQKLKVVSSVIAEEVMKSCQENPSLCVNAKSGVDISGKRKKRSLREIKFKNNLLFERMRFKREALRRDENPAMSNVSHLDVIIYNISSRIGQPSNVETTFFISMMSSSDGNNQTGAVDGKGLLEILRNKKRTLENKLNISIDSFAASKKGNNTPAIPNTSMLNSSGAGNSNMTPQSSGEVVPTTVVVSGSVDEQKQGLRKGTLILIVCAGGAGLILLLIVLIFVITRFVKQRKGEFLPDKIHGNWHDKENGDASMEDVQNLPSIIDPSTPRITDVPHKPTRSQATGRGGGRGAKKAQKPMGVQVTYKPPEWD